MNEWQPIETAPRDGRSFLCGWWNDGHDYFWITKAHFANGIIDGGWNGAREPVELVKTGYWMELPPPPEEEPRDFDTAKMTVKVTYNADAWDSVEFHDLLLAYRETPETDAESDALAYKNLKKFCRNHDKCIRIPPAGEAVDQRLYNAAMAEIERLTLALKKTFDHFTPLEQRILALLNDSRAENDRMRAALVRLPAQLNNVAVWLGNGCDPKHAVTELGLIASRVSEAVVGAPEDKPLAISKSVPMPNHLSIEQAEDSCRSCGALYLVADGHECDIPASE